MTDSGVRLERVSISYYLPPTGNDYSESNHYPSMFADDVAQDLFPVGGEVGREAVFQLSPNDENVSGIIESAFARYGGRVRYGRELSSILSGFGNQTAHSLVSNGAETFEVAPTVHANGQAIGFLVLRLPCVWRFARFTWQTIPKNALRRRPFGESQTLESASGPDSARSSNPHETTARVQTGSQRVASPASHRKGCPRTLPSKT